MRKLTFLLAGTLAGCFTVPSPQPAVAPAAPPPVAYTNPAFQKTPEDLEALVSQMTTGYEPLGEAVTGRLDAFQPLHFEVRRGRCYMVVLRLAQGAQFSEHARRGVGFIFDVAGMKVHGGPGIAGPGGVGSAGCPQQGGPARFDLQAIWGSAMDASRVHELGLGGYTAQLYAKTISDEKLQALRADEERQIEESRRFQQQRAREACQRCVRQREECRDGRHRPFGGSCLSEFDSCVSRSSVRMGECSY